MKEIKKYTFAFPSLIYSVLMGLTTTIHHWHSAIFLHPGSGAIHVVFNELVLIPATVLTMFLYVNRGNRTALRIYYGIALLGFVFLGLYEGGWNHTANLIGHLRIDSVSTDLASLLPYDNPHAWFYEITGVLTFIITLVASWYTWQFYRELKKIELADIYIKVRQN